MLWISLATTWKTLNFYEAPSFTVPNTKFIKALTKLKDIKSLQSRNALQQKQTHAVWYDFFFGNQIISYYNILFVAKRNSPGQISSITKLKGHQITEKKKKRICGDWMN